MPRKKKDAEAGYHAGLYENMSKQELKDTVVRLWKEIKSIEAEKKDYNDSIRDTLKEIKERIDSCVYWVGVKDTLEEKEKLAGQVSEILGE